MKIAVLGSAAGGGFPQWNSNAEGCRRARAGDPAARPRTQASIAVSVDDARWFLINASPGRALEVAKKMEGTSGITAADAITGEYDVIAVCEAPDVNSIGSLIVDKIQKIDGVFKTVTCLAVK